MRDNFFFVCNARNATELRGVGSFGLNSANLLHRVNIASMSEPYHLPWTVPMDLNAMHDQIVVLRNTHWDRVVDINFASSTTGAAIVFATASGSETQLWRIVYSPDTDTLSFVSVYSGLAIEAMEQDRILCQQPFQNTPSQQFRWDRERGLIVCPSSRLFWNLSLGKQSARDWFDPKVPPLGMWRQMPVVVPVTLCESSVFNPPLQFERPALYAVGFVNPRGPALLSVSATPTTIAFDREQSRCLANLPLPDTTNPIAALINYCRHYLSTPLKFTYTEIRPNQNHRYEVWVGNYKVGESEQPRKTHARECAARAALEFLNRTPELIMTLIQKK